MKNTDLQLLKLRQKKDKLQSLIVKTRTTLENYRTQRYNVKQELALNCPHFYYLHSSDSLLDKNGKYIGTCLGCDEDVKKSMSEMEEVLYKKEGDRYESIDLSLYKTKDLFWRVFSELSDYKIFPKGKIFIFTKLSILNYFGIIKEDNILNELPSPLKDTITDIIKKNHKELMGKSLQKKE